MTSLRRPHQLCTKLRLAVPNWDGTRCSHVGCHALSPNGVSTDRKSTRLNSSHVSISYAVFCCFFRSYLRSFPTRRSSDLEGGSFFCFSLNTHYSCAAPY